MKFRDRALLKVYLEAEDLDRFCAQALAQGKATADYARKLILEHLNAASDGQPVRDATPVRVGPGSVAAPRRATRTPPEPKPNPTAEPVKQMQFSESQSVNQDCSHDYGVKKCPFVGCKNYKWKDEK